MTDLHEKAERLWGVWSVTGVHIGTWTDGMIAHQVHADEYPDGTIMEMVPAARLAEVERERDEARARGARMEAEEQERCAQKADNMVKAFGDTITDFNIEGLKVPERIEEGLRVASQIATAIREDKT